MKSAQNLSTNIEQTPSPHRGQALDVSANMAERQKLQKQIIRLGCLCFVMSLIPLSYAQSIVGPQQGSPGQPLVFRLMNGPTQLAVDTWVQELNPDRYSGNDYVTSFTLQMQTEPDGTLTATAPSPGRYKIAAWKGSSAYENYILVQLNKPVPQIRGANFVVNNTPLSSSDKDSAVAAFTLARRAGMNWAAIDEAGQIDFDSPDLQVQLACIPNVICQGATTLGDLGWLVDAAHAQGLSVVLYPSVGGRTKQPINTQTFFYVGQTSDGTFFGDLPPILQAFPSLIPAVMKSYAQYMLQMAQVAQQHGAEALVVGNESNSDNSPGSLLWSQKDQWKAMFTQLRSTFTGKLWVSFAYDCGPVSDLDIWTLGDGISGSSGFPGSAAPCSSWPPPTLDTLTAEQMAANMSHGLNSALGIQLSAATGLPWNVGEFYAMPLDGVNRLSTSIVHMTGQGVRDNQEIVDYVEAQMRSFGQLATGFSFWGVNATPSYLYTTDVLHQPALLNAIANWSGGDTAFLAPCMTPGTLSSGILFQENFERIVCPMDQFDSLVAPTGWQLIQDPQDSKNHVLRATSGGSAGNEVPQIGGLRWTDYEITLRVRLVSGSPNPAAFLSFREDTSNGSNAYTVHFDLGTVGLTKSGSPDFLFLKSYAGGALGQWHTLDVKVLDSAITVSLDGNQISQYTDQTAPISRGGFSLSTYSSDPTHPAVIDFDDITVLAAGKMLPAVSAGGVVNGASLSPGAVAPGSIVSVFGSNLASQPVSAAGSQWPTWLGLGGASLKANNAFPVPVFYVGPNQYNIQIPWELSGLSQAALSFAVDGVTGVGQNLSLAPYAPGIFAMNGQGTGQGAILIANSDTIAAPSGSIAGLNARPAIRGEYLSIYCTGLGRVTNQPADGAAASASVLSTTLASPTATIGGRPATPSFSGLAPSFIGLYQINLQVPPDAPSGGAVPVMISIGGANSNAVTIAVQ